MASSKVTLELTDEQAEQLKKLLKKRIAINRENASRTSRMAYVEYDDEWRKRDQEFIAQAKRIAELYSGILTQLKEGD